MWTPKRVLLLAAGFVLFFGAYLAYGDLLGGVGDIPLPEDYWPRSTEVTPPYSTPPISTVDQRLLEAFGPGCPELHRPIRLGSGLRGMYLAADSFTIEDNGKVRLQPVSLAIFKFKDKPGKGKPGADSKSKNDPAKSKPDAENTPEINTLRQRGLPHFQSPDPIQDGHQGPQ